MTGKEWQALTSLYNKAFLFVTLMYLSTLWLWQSNSIVVSSKRISIKLCPFPTKPQCQDLSSNIHYPNPNITIIVIVFLQYRYAGGLFIMIPQYNDVISPVPWYIVIPGFQIFHFLTVICNFVAMSSLAWCLWFDLTVRGE